MIELTRGCLKGSPQWEQNIAAVQELCPDDFVFYNDEMGDWKFSELIQALTEDDEITARGIGQDAIKKYIWNNLRRLCDYDVPSMYTVVKTAFGCDDPIDDFLSME